MERCNINICGWKKKEKGYQMSTPAENTRYKTIAKLQQKSTESEQGESDLGKALSFDNKIKDREARQSVKANKLQKTVNKRNNLVLNWLAKSHGIKSKVDNKEIREQTRYDKVSSASNSWTQLYKQEESANPFDSEVSEVSFNFESLQRNKSVYKMQNSKSMSECSDGDIEIGHSAMSGRSSTARRRLIKSNKLKELAGNHGKTSLPKTEKRKYGDQHDQESNTAGSNCSDRSSQGGIQVNPSECGSQREQHDEEKRDENRSQAQKGGKDSISENEAKSSNGNRSENNKEAKNDADFGLEILEKFKERMEEEDKDVVYDMFEMILTKLVTMQDGFKTMQETQNELNSKVSEIENNIDVQSQTIDDLDIEMEETNETNMKLIQAVIKNESNIDNVKSEIEKLLKRLNKGTFIIHGVYVGKDQTAKEAIKNFIKEKLEVQEEVEIISAHKMGAAKAAPIWFQLLDADDTALIFKNIKKLKDKTNERDKPYRLQEFGSELVRAQKVRLQDIKMENKRLPESHRVEIKQKNDDLYINDVKYEKQVAIPKMRELLLMDKEEESALDSVKPYEGKKVEENGSVFHVFAIEVEGYEQITEAYYALCKNHMSASQVFCGYRIFGSRFFELQDFQDSSEHGGGKAILDAMKSTKVWNMAIFIVRYHNGPQLGGRRFEIISEMTKQVIASYPSPLNYGQFFTDQVTLKNMNEAALVKEKKKETPNRGHRGTRGGRASRIPRTPRGRPR